METLTLLVCPLIGAILITGIFLYGLLKILKIPAIKKVL